VNDEFEKNKKNTNTYLVGPCLVLILANFVALITLSTLGFWVAISISNQGKDQQI
jgi:p-aminobenzoyl-glutamate transporter AbgT